jgi:ATP-binding cassette subfamily B protein
MIKILRFTNRRDWAQMLVAVGFIVVQVWLDLKLPAYMQEITNLVTAGGDVWVDILRAGGMMLLCAFGSVSSAVVVGFFAARVGSRFAMRLRGRLFDKVMAFSVGEMNRFSTASLITRSTNDVTQIQMMVIMGFQIVIKAPLTAVWAMTKIWGRSFEWTAVAAGAIGFMSVALILLLIIVMPKFRKMQMLIDNLTRVTRENLTGLRVIRAYNAEGLQEEKFEKANEELTYTILFTTGAMAFIMPAMNIIFSCVPLMIYWAGAYIIDGAELAARPELFGNMVVFVSYSMQLVLSFMMLSMIFFMLPRASVSAKRVLEVLRTAPSILEGNYSVAGSEIKPSGEVEFRNVSFKYPDAADYVLKDISFTAGKGETVAFIGSTGSGKSTLVSLIPRFYDVTEGEVLINGVDVREYEFESLYNIIGYVPQKAVLLKGTVASNVAFGSSRQGLSGDEAAEAVKKAVGTAQGTEFVERMDKLYESEIAQGGTNVSGGQKQRLSIARAVYRKPSIYIFDDSFSALDYKTDRLLRDALRRETAGVTSVIVAQRIGTVIDADKIIVLNEGRMVGAGTHGELIKACDVYREIAENEGVPLT